MTSFLVASRIGLSGPASFMTLARLQRRDHGTMRCRSSSPNGGNGEEDLEFGKRER